MGKPVVAVLEPYSSAALLGPALRSAGFSPVAVTYPPGREHAAARPTLHLDDYDAVVNHLGDFDGTVDRLAALGPIAVIPGAERSLHIAEQLTGALGLDAANVPELLPARQNKYLMHQALAAAGLPVIRQICTRDADEVAAWILREGLTGRDLVIKPPASGGTVGVSLAAGGVGWREQFAALLDRRDKLGVFNDQVLVQEYVTGTEFVVDTVSVNGRHSVTNMLEYRKVRRGEGMAVYESMEWLPYDTAAYGSLIEYALAALDAVGLRNWAAHTEIMMTEDGPRLVEINPRLSGVGSPAITLMATGESQVTRIVDVCAGRGDRLPAGFDLRQHYLAVFLIAHSSGVVRNAEIFDRAKSLESYHSPVQVVRSGDRVEASTDLWTSMTMGYIVLAHESAEQTRADREAIRELEKELVIE
ncbi:ATP-grasp domain-containing protein [Kutzneria buriramensis]|uniref:Biotin carboxylase n=1 Tax=Kutzneria buriramensis TaxID=1045776 RepID=A0A3E0HFA8_9PSEU|nr:ATP-grasp domain-containing protein [Kutzneria buriramensis]REH43485.1 biotin carboxylase [Kutzneria buriramensis]